MTLRPVATILLLAVTACGRSSNTLKEQLLRGEALYRTQCAYCHDVEGAIGVELSRRTLRNYRTADRLYRYVQLAMPYQSPRTLSDQEYWDIVAFMIVNDSLAKLDDVFGEGNAEDLFFGTAN